MFAVTLPHSTQANASLGFLSKWSRLSHPSTPAALSHAAGSGALHSRYAPRTDRDICQRLFAARPPFSTWKKQQRKLASDGRLLGHGV